MDPTGAAALAQAIAPPAALERAACRTHAELFTYREPDDVDRDRAYGQAIDVCQHCPVLLACRAWLLTLPRESWPAGVVAAHIVEPMTREQVTNRRHYRTARAKRRLNATHSHERRAAGVRTPATV